ncbi:MAG TPA: ATP-binding protein [Myxococcota bacterium]
MLTIVAYVVLVIEWGAVVWLYLRFRKEAGGHDAVVVKLVGVLAVDAAKNTFESIYFGLLWASRFGLLPAEVADSLDAPLLPKVINVTVAALVLYRIAGDFLPRELRERRRRHEEAEQLRAEQDLSLSLVQESEVRLQSLLERTTDMVVFWRVVNNDIILEGLNSAARTGLELGDDAIGMPAEHVAPESLVTLLEGALATGEPQREEDGWLEVSAGRRAVIRQVVPLADPDGETRRLASFTHDVTASRERHADEEARTRLESLGILAGGVAHDFNNLLAVLRADLDAAHQAVLVGDRPTEHLGHASLTIDRARDLVTQLLAMAGKRAPVTGAVDFGDVVDETARLLRPGMPKGFRLDTRIDPNIVVVGDRSQLQQVALNLMHNAIDATAVSTVGDEPPRIDVSLVVDGNDAVLVVKDNGPGIEPSVQRRVFEPFFSTKRSGRGLGLATVFGLVQAHGGRISVESVVGHGAMFTVRLPRTTAKPEARPTTATMSSSGTSSATSSATSSGRFTAIESPRTPSGRFDAIAPPSSPSLSLPPTLSASSASSSSVPEAVTTALRVLVIDDDDRVRRATRRLLERQGHQIIDVASGEAGLEVTADYDIAVVDVTMPGMDGPTTLKRLRETRPSLPAVLVTGRGDLAGDDDIVLIKPFDGDALQAAVVAAVERMRRRFG